MRRKQMFAQHYTEMYFQKANGATWEELANKFGYKNAESARQTYYYRVIPTIQRIDNENTLDK